MNERLRGTVEMTAAMMILGTIGWFVVLSGVPPVDVVFWRCVFGAVTLFAICAATGLLRGRLTPRVALTAALGGVAIVVNWVLLFSAYSHASIAIATAVYNTQPFMLLVFGALFFGEKLTAAKFVGLLVAFAGLVLIVQSKPAAAYAGTGYVAGIAMALGAAFFWALAAVITKALKGTPPPVIALVQTGVGIALLAPFADLARPPVGIGAWSALGVLGVVHTGFMYVLMYGAVQKLPTHLQGALSFIYPVVAIFVDYAAFGHRLEPLQLIGAAAILLAAAGMTLGWRWLPGRIARRTLSPPAACRGDPPGPG